MKLVDDTLKNPTTGKWSRKNVTSFVSFVFAMIYSETGSYWSDGTVHEFVVFAFLGFAAGLLTSNLWNKN